MMELFPAIDLRDGRCVRLQQGDYERETVYDENPVTVARRFEDECGMTWRAILRRLRVLRAIEKLAEILSVSSQHVTCAG